MKYSKDRSKIKSGDVLAWTHRGWGSWYDVKIQAVRMFQRSEYSHVGIAWVVAGRVFVLEAVVPKIRIYPLSKELPFYHIPISKDYWTPEIEEEALRLVGADYSQWEAIKSFKGGIKVGANSLWQCSEYVTYLLAKGGVVAVDAIKEPTPSNVVAHLMTQDCGVFTMEE